MNKPLRLTFSLLFAAAAVFAGSLSPDLQQTHPATTVRVLIQFNGEPSNGVVNAIQAEGATLDRKYKRFVSTQVYTMRAGKAHGLANKHGIKYISLDRPVQKRLELTAATTGSAAAFQSGLTGQGIGVAVIDSGVDPTHPDLAGRVVYREDFVGAGLVDAYGHGTHVAGIVGASGVSSGGRYRGVAPGTNIVDLRVPTRTARARKAP
jgi:subtilisin family serine protease